MKRPGVFKRLWTPRRLIKGGINLLLIIPFLFLPLGGLSFPVLDSLERLVYDIRLRLLSTQQQDPRIVVADIDEKSLSALGQWPWPRSQLARLVDRLFDDYEIKVLGFDMVFPESQAQPEQALIEQLTQSGLADDPELKTLIENYLAEEDDDKRFAISIWGRNVVMGQVFQQSDKNRINNLPVPLAELPNELLDQLPLPKPRGYTANIALLTEAAGTFGFFDNPLVDDDGIYRRVPLIQAYENGLYQSLALAVTRLALDKPGMDIHLQNNNQGYQALEDIQVGRFIIPVDQSGAVQVPYLGAQGSFAYLSVIDILNQDIPLEQLKDKVVLLGTTAPGLLDLRATPVDKQMPGVEVHANVISGILDQRIPMRPYYVSGVEVLTYLAIGLLMAIVPVWLSPIWVLGFGAAMTSIVVAVNFWFWQKGIMLSLATPILLVGVFFIWHVSWGFLIEARSKRAITRLFGHYVPPELVDEMAQRPNEISLAGESKELSVLFSDVRGFTSISEQLNPKQLTQLMNDILTPLTRVIHQHRGTVDKYMGDAVMAFWGAPLDDSQHAQHAVLAALDMQREIKHLNRSLTAKGWPLVNIGIGINTGTMSVGNMGSEFRMAYTVMGDAVNLGSRLEGLTKQYGAEIIVSEATRQLAPEYVYRRMDCVRVKGKEEPIVIYEPLGLLDEIEQQVINDIELFDQAQTYYCAQNWQPAEKIIKELMVRATDKTNILYQIYLERIDIFRKNPPAEDWDGVFTHRSK